MQLFARKPISELQPPAEGGLKRELGVGDLVLLSIGAVIGAGIFSSIGTAAAGETLADGTVVRLGAGPALVLSFLLVALVCALSAFAYAELSSMIPQAGSAYTYTYATLGELVAWIVGWNLLLEYAIGNIAVAVAWSGYFNSLLSGFGAELPGWLTHGYRTALLSSDPAVHGLLQSAPRLGPVPILVNVPAALIVMAITWVLYIGVRESAQANRWMVYFKLLVLAFFVVIGALNVNPDNYTPFAPNGWTGIGAGAGVLFFAYIGFDAISTAAEETKDAQRNVPKGIMYGLAICTAIYVVVGLVATGLVPYMQLKGADPLARALELAGLPIASWFVALGAVISLTAVLLVFQYGQPRIFMAMARDGLLPRWAAAIHPKYRTPHITTFWTGVVVALGSMVLDENEIYDLTSIGTLAAFAIVSIGVLVLRRIDPDRPRAFRAPAIWVVAIGGALGCIYVMTRLPDRTWLRFAVWSAVGIALYFAYGFRHSNLRGKTSGSASA